MPRNPEQNQRARDERREQILETALRLFAETGLAATRTSRIARECGVSEGLIYHYFSSKEALYTELVERAFERLNGAVRALEALPEPPAEKIRIAIRELLRGMEANESFPRNFLLTLEVGTSNAVPEEAKAVFLRERDLPYRRMEEIMRKGQGEGTVREGDPAELALLFWTMIRGLTLHRAARGAAFRAPEARLLERVFLNE